jgi:CRP/FNR family transcriptional regulator, cyclic AMP receptor protein
MTKPKLVYLTENELFHGMSPHELQELERALAMTTCEKARLFYVPGESGEALFLLKEGRVQLYRLSPEGKKLVIEILEPGTVFGEMSLFGQHMRDTFAEALEPCVLCVMSRNDVERMLQQHPPLALHLLEIVGHRLIEIENRLTELSFLDVAGRVAALLLRLHEKSGDQISGYSHQDLADQVGTYRETVTQVLNQFRQKGLIELQRKEIVILDPKGLQQIANEGE